MKITQVYEIVNSIAQEALGESVVVAEDLNNIVDIGRAFENMDGRYDNFVRRLPDHTGRVINVDRPYTAPILRKMYRDGWEFGAMLQKTRMKLPEAQVNETWSLYDGESVDPFVVTTPDISTKFYSDRTTYTIPMTKTERQIKSAFSNAVQMNSFLSMIDTNIRNSAEVRNAELARRVLNAGISETLYSAYPSGNYSANAGNVRAVNLLYAYNQASGSNLTVAKAMFDANFIRFASYQMKNYINRMRDYSSLFNGGSYENHTPADRLDIYMLTEFRNAAGVYLYDGLNQFNTDNVKFPDDVETVSYWQGSGTDYAFGSTSAINVTNPFNHTVNASGILAVFADHDSMAITNENRRVDSIWNPRGEYWNEFHKFDAGFMLDVNENFVVFFIA